MLTYFRNNLTRMWKNLKKMNLFCFRFRFEYFTYRFESFLQVFSFLFSLNDSNIFSLTTLLVFVNEVNSVTYRMEKVLDSV